MLRRKVTGKTSSVPEGLLAGTIVSVIVTVIITAILAELLKDEIISWTAVGYIIGIMIILSSFFGAMTAWKHIRRQKLLICVMSGIMYWGILLAVTALFFGGQFQAVEVTLLLVVAGCGCASIAGESGRRRG